MEIVSLKKIDIIERGESILSDEELVGYYFAEIIDFQRRPHIIFRDYFDYETLESDSFIYLI